MPKIDARGWIGLAVFSLTVMVLWMVAKVPELRHDEFFKVLATAIVLTGFIQSVVGWGFNATKQGGELADSAARIVEQSAAANVDSSGKSSALGDQVQRGAEDGARKGVSDGLDQADISRPAAGEPEILT